MRTPNKHKCAVPVGPGRCTLCGRLMMVVRLPSPVPQRHQARRLGWRCIWCDTVMALPAFVRQVNSGTMTTPATLGWRG